jgi:hypothetical protein
MRFFTTCLNLFRKNAPSPEAEPQPAAEDLRPQARAVLARCTNGAARVIHHLEQADLWHLTPQQTVVVLAQLKAYFIGLAFQRLAVPSKNPADQAYATTLHQHLKNMYHEELAATGSLLEGQTTIPDLIEELNRSETPAAAMAHLLAQMPDTSPNAADFITGFLEKEGIRFLAQV